MRIGIGIGFGLRLGGGGAFALSNAQWTVIERPEDANRKRPQVDVYAEPPAGTRFLASRTANANGIPTSGNFAELTFIGVGHYRWQGSSQVTSAEEQIVVWTVASDVSAPVPTMVLGAPNPAVTRVSLNKPFQPSGVPFAPAFTYYADGSGTAVQIRLSPRAVNEGNGRNGVTPWRAVDQLRWRIGAGADTTISDADTIDLTGLSASQSVTIAAHNINGWGPDQTVTVLAELPALGSGDWTLTDAGDGANLLATISAGLVSPSGAAATGYQKSLDAGAYSDLDTGGAIPASVGSHDVILRGVFDLGIGMPSDEKTASVAALSVFPSIRASITDRSTTATSSHDVDLPTHVAGDLLLVNYSPDGSAAPTVPGGWAIHSPGTLRDPSLHWIWKRAASAAETLVVTPNNGETFASTAYSIQDVHPSIDPEFSAYVENYGASNLPIDVASLSLAGGSAKALWFLGIAHQGATAVQTGAPSGWSNYETRASGTTNADATVATCALQYEGASLDPPAWPVSTRLGMASMVALVGAASGSVTAISGASLAISPESPVNGETVTFTFTYAAGTTPITTSLTINGVNYNSTTGVFAISLPAGSYPYTWSSSNAAGAGPSGSGTLVVAAAPTITASVSLSPSSPTAGQTVTATVTVSPTDATPGLSVVNGGSSVTITSTGANTWTFTAPATGTTTVTPTATLDATVVSGTPATFSTGAAPVSANAPKLWGVPEVGDLLELIAGTGVSSPSYLIERTDNGGSTYATEKTAAAGEFFVVPNQVGRQYRAVMVAPDTTRTVGAWTEPVAAAGPQIAVASVDGRTLAVQTPAGTGTLRARPYGGGTAITAAVSGTTTNITLTDNGCWQIDYAPDGVTYGALAYRWCWTVGAISYFGRNVAEAVMSEGVEEGIVVVVPISGRQATMDAPTPVHNQEDRTLPTSVVVPIHTNGVMKNFTAGLDYNLMGHAAYDNRVNAGVSPYYVSVRTTSTGAFNPNFSDYLQTFDISNLCTKWPQMLAENDGFQKAVSTPDRIGLQAHRQGYLSQFGGLVCALSLPSAGQFAQKLTRYPGWTGGHVTMTDLASVIATLQGMSLSTAGMDVPDTAEILRRLKRFNPSLSMYRGGNHDIDSHERVTTYRNGWDFTAGNYYQYQLISFAFFLLTSDAVDNAWKAEMATALAFWGHQIDIPGHEAQTQAGISQHHEPLIAFSRICKGETFTDLPSTQIGNHLRSYSKFTAADAALFLPHDNPDWPWFSRRKQAVNVASDATYYYISLKRLSGDGSQTYFQGLSLCREDAGAEKVEITDSDRGAGTTGNLYYRVRVLKSAYATAPTIGEWFYCEVPTGAQTAVYGDPYYDWDNGRVEDKKGGSYTPSPGKKAGATPDGYRTINEPHGFLWITHALDAWPDGEEEFDKVKIYTQNTFEADYPGTGLMDMQFTLVSGLCKQMWAAHHATLGL